MIGSGRAELEEIAPHRSVGHAKQNPHITARNLKEDLTGDILVQCSCNRVYMEESFTLTMISSRLDTLR